MKSNTANDDDRFTPSCTSDEPPTADVSKNETEESGIVQNDEEQDEHSNDAPEISTELAVDSAQDDYSCSELISGEFM